MQTSIRTKIRICARHLAREGYVHNLSTWGPTKEYRTCDTSKYWASNLGFAHTRTRKHPLDGMERPFTETRGAKRIRDTRKHLKTLLAPEERAKALEQARGEEMRGKIKEEFSSLLRKHGVR